MAVLAGFHENVRQVEQNFLNRMTIAFVMLVCALPALGKDLKAPISRNAVSSQNGLHRQSQWRVRPVGQGVHGS